MSKPSQLSQVEVVQVVLGHSKSHNYRSLKADRLQITAALWANKNSRIQLFTNEECSGVLSHTPAACLHWHAHMHTKRRLTHTLGLVNRRCMTGLSRSFSHIMWVQLSHSGLSMDAQLQRLHSQPTTMWSWHKVLHVEWSLFLFGFGRKILICWQYIWTYCIWETH